MPCSPPRSSRCPVFAFRASQEGDLALPLAPASRRSAPGRPRLRCSAHESPPAHASPASHTHGSTDRSISDFQGAQRQREKQRGVPPCPDVPHAASRLPARVTGAAPAGSATAAARGQMAEGTRGARNAKKGEVGELRGLNFCLLSARRGEAQPGYGANPSRGLGSPQAPTGTDTAGCWATDPRQGRRRCRRCTPEAAPVLLPPTL